MAGGSLLPTGECAYVRRQDFTAQRSRSYQVFYVSTPEPTTVPTPTAAVTLSAKSSYPFRVDIGTDLDTRSTASWRSVEVKLALQDGTVVKDWTLVARASGAGQDAIGVVPPRVLPTLGVDKSTFTVDLPEPGRSQTLVASVRATTVRGRGGDRHVYPDHHHARPDAA